MRKNKKVYKDNLIDSYDLPVRFYPNYKKSYIYMLIFMGLLALINSWLIIDSIIRKDLDLIYAAISTMFFWYYPIDFISVIVSKNQYFEITTENIELKTLFRLKKVSWNEILSLERYEYKALTGLAIIRIKDTENTIAGVLKSIGRLFHMYYMLVLTNKYMDLNIDKVMQTAKRYHKFE